MHVWVNFLLFSLILLVGKRSKSHQASDLAHTFLEIFLVMVSRDKVKSHRTSDLCSYLIYLWRKVVCFVVMRSTEPGCFRSWSWCLWKALVVKEVCTVFDSMTFWTFGAKVLEYSINFFTEKFGEIGMCLGCCWKDLDEQEFMEFIW